MRSALVVALAAVSVLASAAQAQSPPQPASGSGSADEGEAAVRYIRACYTVARFGAPQSLAKPVSCATLTKQQPPSGVTAAEAASGPKGAFVRVTVSGQRMRFDGSRLEPDGHTPQTRMRAGSVSCWSVDGIFSRCTTDDGHSCTWWGNSSPTCH